MEKYLLLGRLSHCMKILSDLLHFLITIVIFFRFLRAKKKKKLMICSYINPYEHQQVFDFKLREIK